MKTDTCWYHYIKILLGIIYVNHFLTFLENMSKDCLETRILQTTCQLLLEQGIRSLTFEHIATRAQTTKMGIFRIFQTKQHLIETALKELDRSTQEKWELRLSQSAPGMPALRALLTDIFTSVSQSAHRGCPLALSYAEHNENQNAPDPTDHALQWEPLHRIAQSHKRALHQHLYYCLQQAQVTNPKEKALFLSTLIDGMYLNQNTFLLSEHPSSTPYILEQALSVCLAT